VRDMNPALSSKLCPKCKDYGLRPYIAFHFIQHYGVYCTTCNYKTEASPSQNQGLQEWMNAKERDESLSEMILRVNKETRDKQ